MSEGQMSKILDSSTRGLRTINGVDSYEGLPVTVYDVSEGVDVVITDYRIENSKEEFERVLCLRKDGRILLTTTITDDQLEEFVHVLFEGYEAKKDMVSSWKARLQYTEFVIRACLY